MDALLAPMRSFYEDVAYCDILNRLRCVRFLTVFLTDTMLMRFYKVTGFCRIYQISDTC